MKLFTNISALLLLNISFIFPLTAQTIIPVSPDVPGNVPGALNDAIDDYVATNGDPDLDVIFQLADSGLYVLRATIDYEFPLRIEAEPGTTTKPAIRPGVPVGGGDGFRAFRIRNDFILRGVYVTNEDPSGGVEDQIIRISAENARVVIEDCHLDRSSQSAFRLDNSGNRLFISNSIISNIFNLANPSNGRGIDDRGNDIDTLWVENSTFYNLSARLLREDGGTINFIRWVKTTCVNTGDRTLDMGVAFEVEVRDNIFHNYAFLGDDEPGTSTLRVDSAITETQTVIVRNNNLSVDSTIFEAVYDSINAVAAGDPEVDSVFFRANLNGPISAFVEEQGFDTTITFANITFENPPAPPAAYVASLNLDPDNLVDIDRGNGGLGPDQIQLPFDFSYISSSTVTEGAVDGGPLGDPRWTSLSTSIRNTIFSENSVKIGPNPFTDLIRIEYKLKEAANTHMFIVDLMGRKLAELSKVRQAAGVHEILWRGQDLQGQFLPSGHYIAIIQAGSQIYSKHLIKQ